MDTFERVPEIGSGKVCRRCCEDLDRSREPCWRCVAWPVGLTAVAAVKYGGAAESVVRALKYNGCRHLADICAAMMIGSLEQTSVELDALVPVPLYPARQRERGFNQARLIAGSLGHTLETDVLQLLERVRPTRSQVGLGRAARAANVSGAFVSRADPAGSTVGLIDDVATSGATIRAAAEALLGAGATAVIALTFALASDRNAG